MEKEGKLGMKPGLNVNTHRPLQKVYAVDEYWVYECQYH